MSPLGGEGYYMKKTLMILGSIFAVLIIASVIGFSVLAVKGKALDKESKTYVDQVTPLLLENLSKDNLFKYASDELKNSSSPEEFVKLFNFFSKLGRFRKYIESKGQANISVTTDKGKQITGYYEAQADFENGPATIKITTIKKGDQWQVIGFHINSMALANY